MSQSADPPNAAPKITARGDQTVTVGKPLKVAANATDDGIPKARNRNPRPANSGLPAPPPRMSMPAATPAPRAQLGLRIRWILYRAPDSGGTVSFHQESGAPVVGAQGAELATEATFSAPGTYWLRAIATDGLLETPYDLKITVFPPRDSGQLMEGRQVRCLWSWESAHREHSRPVAQAR